MSAGMSSGRAQGVIHTRAQVFKTADGYVRVDVYKGGAKRTINLDADEMLLVQLASDLLDAALYVHEVKDMRAVREEMGL